MWLVVGGVVLVLLWFLEIGPLASLAWGWLCVPFVLAVVWWSVADSMGLTQRAAVRKLEARKIARRQRDMEALGLTARREKRSIKVLRDQRRDEEANPPASPSPADPARRDPRS
jgi:small Trp-rich protein